MPGFENFELKYFLQGHFFQSPYPHSYMCQFRTKKNQWHYWSLGLTKISLIEGPLLYIVLSNLNLVDIIGIFNRFYIAKSLLDMSYSQHMKKRIWFFNTFVIKIISMALKLLIRQIIQHILTIKLNELYYL